MKRVYVWHSLGWIIFFLLPIFFTPLNHNLGIERVNYDLLLGRIPIYLILIGLFYANLHILFPYFSKSNLWAIYVLIQVGIIIVYIFIQKLLFVHSLVDPPFHAGAIAAMPHRIPRGADLPFPLLLSTVLSYTLVLSMSSFIAIYREKQAEIKKRRKIEMEKISAELAVLKLQISPHFLFNTLNNIRWLARQKSIQTESAVMQLSEILRYMVYEVDAENVPLVRELEHIRNFIELQKMRLVSDKIVHYTLEGNPENKFLTPLLLIPFIENSFKYGISGSPEDSIRIEIKVVESRLEFRVENQVNDSKELAKKDEGGMGIDNVKRRLNLLYVDHYDLQITNMDGMYCVYLSLDLNGG